MLEFLYTWIEDIAFYMVIITGALSVAPAEYRKYIRFYTGLTLIILTVSPLMKICGMEADFNRRVCEIKCRFEEEGKGMGERFKEAASRIFSSAVSEDEKEEGERRIKVREVKVDP